MTKCCAILLLLFLIVASAYKAGVIEYNPRTSDTARNTILKNLEEFRYYADKARTQAVDILVFPEYGLTTLVDPEDYALEIHADEKVITELATMATERQMYLVVNLLEKARDDRNNTKYYNTNLVFARNGTIIAKYRKINLFNEPKLTPGSEDQRVTFQSDSGVTFGTFTGFDILFENPSRTVLHNSNVTVVLFPTALNSSIPFFTSLSIQHGYASANGVNLFAANYGEPKNAHGGSGIYSGDGTKMNVYIDGSPSSKLIVSNVAARRHRMEKTVCSTNVSSSSGVGSSKTKYALPGSLSTTNITNYVTKKDFDAWKYTLQSVSLDQGDFSTTVCHNQFCCTFNITVEKNHISSRDNFKVMAFDGQNSYNVHIRVCSLLACEFDEAYSCGARINTTTKFTKITVNAHLQKEEGTFYMPLTLNYNLKPIMQTSYCDTNNGTNGTFVQLTTTAAQENILVFGLLGRSSARKLYAVFILVILGVANCFIRGHYK
ncbi:hypothetical protein MTP99_000176 [Tenebrio molitor]|nr:hypothetical protein MTP99_000176 [Tenebrio molitor]